MAVSQQRRFNTPTKSKKFKFLTRVFPIVILSDHFPSLSILANELIVAEEQRFPAVIDIFFLDVLLTVIRDPVEVLYYLQQRTRFFKVVQTDSEFNLLGFHLKHKLFIPAEYDFA